MQAGPLASPPSKMKEARRQVVFKLSASLLIKAGLATLAVMSLGGMMEAFPVLCWLQTFSFMSQFPCAEAVLKGGAASVLSSRGPSLPLPSPSAASLQLDGAL